MNKAIKRNKILSVVQISLRTVATLCASGTLMQTFLAYIGFAESNIYLHATLISAVNLTSMLLFSHYADTKSILKRSALAQIPNGILFLCLLPFCFSIDATPGAFILLLGVSLFQAVCSALTSICEYKLPYYLYRAEDYGTVQALTGVLYSVIIFLIGLLIDYLKGFMPFDRIMMYAFIISSVVMVIAGTISFCFTIVFSKGGEREENEKAGNAIVKEKKVSTLAVFKTPVFYLLAPANLLRGISLGCVNVLATVAIALHYDGVAPLMVSIASVAELLACFVFGAGCRYLTPRLFIFLGSLCFLLMPLGLLSPTLFLLMYAAVYFGRSIVNIAVPTLLVRAVDAEIAGPYNAWRLILNTGGMMIATSVAALPFVTPAMLLWGALGCAVFSGVCFTFLPLLRRASPFFIHGRPHLLNMHKK